MGGVIINTDQGSTVEEWNGTTRFTRSTREREQATEATESL